MEEYYQHYQFPIHHKRKRVLCEDPATCPFCEVGIERKVEFQIWDEQDKVMRSITMPEKVYNKIMDKKGGEL